MEYITVAKVDLAIAQLWGTCIAVFALRFGDRSLSVLSKRVLTILLFIEVVAIILVAVYTSVRGVQLSYNVIASVAVIDGLAMYGGGRLLAEVLGLRKDPSKTSQGRSKQGV
jgi:hypothetical protein